MFSQRTLQGERLDLLTMETIRAAQEFLRQSQLPNGSWPYAHTSAQGSPEPTCYSILALHDDNQIGDDSTIQSGLNWLAHRVNADGALTLEGDDEPHWSTAHLVLTLTHLDVDELRRQRILAWLLTWQGNTGPDDPYGAIPINANLVGWPWINDAFSWVEPTCFALLALKRSGVVKHERIAQGEALLYDRVCMGGGWNVGNPIIWGQALDAFLPQTALALLALQDVGGNELILPGLSILQKPSNPAHSTLALALTVLCLNAYNLPTDPFADRLQQRQMADGSWRGMIHLTALSVLALRSVSRGSNVFKL
jgi:hypothetical protein